jgi:HD-GYP domain-containing protein (c-di-GMP phosphodiesterase class II)
MMLYKKAPYYSGHGLRMAALVSQLGRRLGLAGDDLETLVLAALLHGIGKVSLPAEILVKPDELSEAEQHAMRNHVQIGEELFEGLDHLEPLRPILRAHHERYDGNRHAATFPSYPDGIAGERIPLGARVLKLAEALDAIVTDRPWRQARPADEAVAILRAESGRSFDPRLVRILLADEEWRLAVEDPQHELAPFLSDTPV